jgi:predicted rRNA methylase YqxC with S4 and FtsJ domains
MALSPQAGGMRVILQGEAGHVYCIETSTDLVHWSVWTNQTNSTGTISITDTDATNYPMRFYRAKPVP